MENKKIPNAVKIIPPKKTDYFAGTLPYEVRISNGDWTSYLPVGEIQKDNQTDFMACVTFSALNSLETQFQWLLINNKIPQIALDWLKNSGYIVNGELSLSDRFSARMSGTDLQGNSFTNVADSIRKDGVLPESDWTWNKDTTWEEFYKDIPQGLKDKAKQFLNYFTVRYEWIIQNSPVIPALTEHLKQCPIQIAIPLCSGYTWASIVKACSLKTSQHAVMVYRLDGTIGVFDSYPEYQKELEKSYPLFYGLKLLLSINPSGIIETAKTEISLLQKIIELLKKLLALKVGSLGKVKTFFKWYFWDILK